MEHQKSTKLFQYIQCTKNEIHTLKDRYMYSKTHHLSNKCSPSTSHIGIEVEVLFEHVPKVPEALTTSLYTGTREEET